MKRWLLALVIAVAVLAPVAFAQVPGPLTAQDYDAESRMMLESWVWRAVITFLIAGLGVLLKQQATQNQKYTTATLANQAAMAKTLDETVMQRQLAIVATQERMATIMENHLNAIGIFMATQTEVMRGLQNTSQDVKNILIQHDRDEREFWGEMRLVRK